MSFVANEEDPFTRKVLRFWLLVAPQHHVTSDHHTHRSEGIAQRRGEPESFFSAPPPLRARFFRGPLYVVYGTDEARNEKRRCSGLSTHTRRNPGLCGRIPLGFPEGKRRSPDLRRSKMVKSVHAHTHTPFPTPKALCHTARGYAVPGVTPGMRTDCPSTPTALCRSIEGLDYLVQGRLRYRKPIITLPIQPDS